MFISQLIRYSRACSSYECFILRARRLSSKLLKQGYLVERLKSSFRKFYGRYRDLIQQYGVTLSRMLNDILTLDQQWLSTNFMTFIPSLTLTELWVVSMEHLQRVWLASRERLPFRTPGSVPHFGTCQCSNCWDQIPRTCHVFTRLFTSNTPWYFLDFAFKCISATPPFLHLNKYIKIIKTLRAFQCFM